MPLQFEARKVALKQDRTGFVLTLAIHPDETPEELLRDFVGARYACVMVRIKDDETATPYTNRVMTAGILCRTPKFHDFLCDVYTFAKVDEPFAAQLLCDLCGIASRSELNGNKSAMEKFDAVLKEFEDWKLDGVTTEKT
jgi:hypothetical protein